jgi:hypothetical protein
VTHTVVRARTCGVPCIRVWYAPAPGKTLYIRSNIARKISLPWALRAEARGQVPRSGASGPVIRPLELRSPAWQWLSRDQNVLPPRTRVDEDEPREYDHIPRPAQVITKKLFHLGTSGLSQAYDGQRRLHGR